MKEQWPSQSEVISYVLGKIEKGEARIEQDSRKQMTDGSLKDETIVIVTKFKIHFRVPCFLDVSNVEQIKNIQIVIVCNKTNERTLIKHNDEIDKENFTRDLTELLKLLTTGYSNPSICSYLYGEVKKEIIGITGEER